MVRIKPKKKYKDRKIGNPQHRNMAVGHFYTHLAQRLLGGKIKPFSYAYGDIENFKLGLLLEVKSCNNQHQLRVFTEQLERFLENLFPFDRCLFVLFRYKNNFRNGAPQRISKVAQTEKQLYKTLACRTADLYLLDAGTILAVKQLREGASKWRRGGERVEVITLNQSFLKQLFGGAPEAPLVFGSTMALVPHSARIELIFWGNKMAFECHSLLPDDISGPVLDKISRSRGLKIFLAETRQPT